MVKTRGPKRARRAGPVGRRPSSFLGIETKFFDSSRAASALTAPTDAAGGEHDPTTLNTLFAPVQGTGAQNRDGRKVKMTSIEISGVVDVSSQVNQTATDVSGKVFIALVLDKQTNAAQLNSEDVFDNQSASVALAASPMRDLERSTRFRVLKKWEFVIAQPEMVFDGTNIEQMGYHKAFYLKMGLGQTVEFIANGGTVADIQDNSLHMVAYCSNTSLAPRLNYNCRVNFIG